MQSIPGSVPSPFALPKGCRFSPRCPYATKKCQAELPALLEVKEGQFIRCFYANQKERKSDEHRRLVIHSEIDKTEVKENELLTVSDKDAYRFLGKLEKGGLSATLRRKMGEDIDGACGQLRQRYIEENS